MLKELKPCPFCGDSRIFIDMRNQDSIAYYVAFCFGCGARTSPYVNEQDAIEAWNLRVSQGGHR